MRTGEVVWLESMAQCLADSDLGLNSKSVTFTLTNLPELHSNL